MQWAYAAGRTAVKSFWLVNIDAAVQRAHFSHASGQRIMLTPKAYRFNQTASSRSNISRKRIGQFKPTIFEGQHAVSPPCDVPANIIRPSYALRPDGIPPQNSWNANAEVKSAEEIYHMREAARLAANCLSLAAKESREGITTEELDQVVHEYIISHGAYPTAINYYGFPKSFCASPNEVACHGIPNNRPLQDGDIISYDCTVYLNGFHGDCAGTYCIGSNVSPQHKQLVNVAYEALLHGIGKVAPNANLSDIGCAIEEFVTLHGFSVVAEFCGHFIGRELHMPPLVSHVQAQFEDSCNEILKPGQIFTIEPLVCEGDTHLDVWDDTWTMVTRDKGRCAQWEHTVLVTNGGYEILTLSTI